LLKQKSQNARKRKTQENAKRKKTQNARKRKTQENAKRKKTQLKHLKSYLAPVALPHSSGLPLSSMYLLSTLLKQFNFDTDGHGKLIQSVCTRRHYNNS
jgi:hypothetical protein